MEVNENIVSKYIEAWRLHDVEILNSIFSEDCKYEIHEKPGFYGIENVKAYWKRNKERQTKLDLLEPSIFYNDEGLVKFAFCAVFFDREESQHQTVFGTISLTILHGKVTHLSESYQVNRRTISRSSLVVIKNLKNLASINFKKLVHSYLPRFLALVALLVSLLTAFFYLGIGRLPDAAVCTLSGVFNDCDIVFSADQSAVEKQAYRNLGLLTSVLLLLAPFVANYLARVKYGRVKTTQLVREQQDLDIMRSRFKGAREITIFSGNFSFAKDYGDFFSIFLKLATRGKLYLISEDKKEDVLAGLGGTLKAKHLINLLEKQGNIVYSNPVPIKCSIVRRWDGVEVLYRFEYGGSEGSPFPHQMCELKRRGDISPICDLIEDLARRRSNVS